MLDFLIPLEVHVTVARRCLLSLLLAAPIPFSCASSFAQQSSPTIDTSQYSAMRWRLIGPYRAGRVTAVAGIPGDPALYYIGTPGGGVWKTTDGGNVWKPIFDDQHVASIGAVALAPSNPNILYVGTGEQTPGNGMYKSTDAGATWSHIGLEKSLYITSILVDPRNPDIVTVGVLGHPILGLVNQPAERGVFKSVNGGKTWARMLARDELDGIADMCADPENPREFFAAVWHRSDPLADPSEKKDEKPKQDAWIYKSLDGGSTWNQVAGQGLPSEPLGRIGLAVAPATRGRRVFAITLQGLFRSDDAGDTWRKITTDPRVIGNGYFSRVFVDPHNPEMLFVMQTCSYRSTDGGQTFAAFKGAPGGDDYHVLWIDPQNSNRLILGVDQGATISLDAGKSWSAWFNQPTGQFYHVITDNQFPYVAYAPQQDSGTAAVPSRSNFGEIGFRDWFSIGGFEFCYIAPDPLNPNIVYSGGWYGSVVRFDKTTGQISHVFVPGSDERTSQMPPLIFSPQNPRLLYYGTQYVLQTTNNGDTWQRISPDLTARNEAPAKPPAGKASGHELEDEFSGRTFEDDDKDAAQEQTPRRRMSLTALAPSPLAAGMLWAGTGNGLIELTTDAGATWQNVSPPELKPDTMVSIIEPSHFDARTAYVAAINSRDPAPYIYRTRDAGKSWQKITQGLEPGWFARVVREDPVRKGLLYGGTLNAVYVSFDDGDHWQSLELNLPTADMRDLAVHENDLVVATYGRALWVLDDLSPLRQAGTQIAASKASLLRPATAVRVRWDNDQETPLPPEVPAGQNPPEGALFYYYLPSAPASAITLEIHDAKGNLVRRFSSDPPPPDKTIKNVPDYWFAPQTGIPKNAGLNRFAWDLHYAAPPTLLYSYYGNALDYVEYTLTGNAIAGVTPREETPGPYAVPGEYQVVLTVDGQKFTQPLLLTIDPHLHLSQSDLNQQFAAASRVDAGLQSSYTAFGALAALRNEITLRKKNLEANTAPSHAPLNASSIPQANDAPKQPARAATPDAANDSANDSAKDATKGAPNDPVEALKSFATQLDAIQVGTPDEPGVGPINRDLARLAFMVESGDAAPTAAIQSAIDESCTELTTRLAEWHELQTHALPSLNATLEKLKIPPLPLPSAEALENSAHNDVDAAQP
jgi:photosystem II stability/assembly factor-like uncharacterized protein